MQVFGIEPDAYILGAASRNSARDGSGREPGYVSAKSHLIKIVDLLGYPNFDGELDEIILKAKQDGVDYILVPATDLKTAEQVIELTKKYEMVYGAVGVHPHDTKKWNSSFIPKVEKLAENKKIVAIGEIGLDYYYDFSTKEKQIEAFKAQIELALKLNLPVIIHNRDSDEDMMNIIRSYCGAGLKAQYHCYNGSLEDAMELVGMNYMISFTGNITFKKADGLRKILQHMLNTKIGYMQAAEIAKESEKSGRPVKDIVVEKGLMPAAEFGALVLAAAHGVGSGGRGG